MRIRDWSSDVCSSDLADDVVYTLNRVSSPEAAVVNPKMVNWIGSAEKVDDFTVRVLMEEPFPAALEYLAAAVPIYPNEYYEKVGPEGMSDRKSTRLNSSH